MQTQMLKYSLILTIFFAHTPTLFSFRSVPSKVIGSGIVISKTYTFDTKDLFTNIRTDSIGSIEIKIGTANNVVVSAEDNIIPLLEVYVENSVLVISHGPYPASFQTTKPIHYSLELTLETLQSMHALTNHGSASITVIDSNVRFASNFELQSTGGGTINISEALLNANTVNIVHHGSGHISCTGLHADSLDINSTGGGTIEIRAGTVKKATILSYGSGSLDMRALDATDTITIVLSGSGRIDCFTRNNIEVSISGSGSVTNYAHAKSKEINKSGSGQYREII
jgi:putative autotransporter adhesin-like protein